MEQSKLIKNMEQSKIIKSMESGQKILKIKFEGYSIYFLLHSLTLITALTWHSLIESELISVKSSRSIYYGIGYALIITMVTVLLHMILGKYMIKPSDSE
jgi:hypothetical protein